MIEKTSSTSKIALYTAVSLAYAGEYNALIAILEHARQLGGASHAVIFYLIYCIPAVILLVVSGVWKSAFTKSKEYLPLVFAGSALVITSFVKAEQVGVVILCVFLISMFRQWTRALTLSLIQSYFVGKERNSITSQIISLRFVVMIVGATIGGYLGERQLFSLSLLVNAFCYLGAAAAMLVVTRRLGEPACIEEESLNSTGFFKRISEGLLGLRNSIGISLFAVVLITSVGVNAFMALEYPILTSDLGVAPSKLFLVYFGHILGAVIAGRVGGAKWVAEQSHGRSYILAVLLCLSYAFIGFVSNNMIWISFQLGICAFFLPLFETHYSSVLMNNATRNYPSQNLTLNFFVEMSNLLGSALPLLLLVSMTSIDANRTIQVIVICIILTLGFLLRKSEPVRAMKRVKL
ncbi:MAG: MFS transporter [Bdellovibrionota bacterium]